MLANDRTVIGATLTEAPNWYLSASPELMAVAGTRLEQYLADRLVVRR
jgi:hypothetical protein